MELCNLEEALNAASAIGDDLLLKQAAGRVAPDSFKYGTSAQRAGRSIKCIETGDVSQGDTFNTSQLKCISNNEKGDMPF